ncbi:hypothetical protein [Brumimicrobium aurantiacum]|uniref:Lipoprotein n=1 Tax=Brumimicrobium aurantiacum TaxID=1737063 RepID=A0A3E1EZS3_9FLAO|nr:hypothetical protein [Brumimicrobium aurantiacum]RFC55072.1 hypothetical protein DXU93_04425 [Brumimicrobium aurantiacum]
MRLFRLQIASFLIVLFSYSCEGKVKEKLECVQNESYSMEINKYIPCFNLLFEETFNKISYSIPDNLDTVFYNDIDNYYSFFVKLENENLFLYLYVDTFNTRQRGIKFHQLNSIEEKLYINQNESLVCFYPFFEKCKCDSSNVNKLELKSVINTYDTHLLGSWKSNEGIKISFEEDYIIHDSDTSFYHKLGSYLVDKSTRKDTLATIQAISMNKLILKCDFISKEKMIYFNKSIIHPLSRKDPASTLR